MRGSIIDVVNHKTTCVSGARTGTCTLHNELDDGTTS
jgi:hypothetical protein